MSLVHIGPGDVIPITGKTTGLSSGALYSVGSAIDGVVWWGIVQDDIIGTTEALTTIDGRPILDEDVSQLGDGAGDMMVTGVHQCIVASGAALAGVFAVGEPVYASGFDVLAGVDSGTADSAIGSDTVQTLGMVHQSEAVDSTGTGGMSLCGHVWKVPYLETNTGSPLVGSWVAEIKLLGHPAAGRSADG